MQDAIAEQLTAWGLSELQQAALALGVIWWGLMSLAVALAVGLYGR